MNKLSEYIFTFSPKKLAVYLVIGTMLLLFIQSASITAFLKIQPNATNLEIIITIVLAISILGLAYLVFLWLFWLQSTVYSIDERELGLTRKWFPIAFGTIIVFIFFNSTVALTDWIKVTQTWIADYMYLINASREFINFAGIMIAYPIICHYAARAATTKRNKQPATFINSIPFTLLLVFGGFLGIPFLQGYFSTKSSTNSQIMIIYAIAFGLCIILFIAAFVAAIAGLV